MINGCWLRYSYRPEYACYYFNDDMDPAVWIEEDTLLPMTDARNLLDRDVDPHHDSDVKGVLISGDFNSGSHLDWTPAAKELHNGYGPVALPVSKYMNDRGYKDSFHELNPNEITHQGGTFAVIFGQLQASRIDYIYYKGAIKPLFSKIIRSTYEIDDIWASDHAAVVAVFDTSGK